MNDMKNSPVSEPALEAPYDLIMFDMDGTLLPLEVRDFLAPYYELLVAAADRDGLDAQRLRNAVNKGIFGMYDHPTSETNETAFWRVFYASYFDGNPVDQQQKDRFYRFFTDFYIHEFNKAGEGVEPNPAARRAIEALAAKGYPLYLTTMPMFPLSAIEWRMKWADAPIEPFCRVTTFDNSTAVKPHLAYYEENLALADVPANRILMVGNNTEDDMAAMQVGMDVFLVTDYLINQNEFEVSAVKHGSLEEFADWASGLPACTSTRALSWQDRADELRIGGAGALK